MAAYKIVPSVNRIVNSWVEYKRNAFAAEKIAETFADAPQIRFDAVPAGRLPFEREIKVDDVTFRYEPEGKAVLDRFSLTIRKGEKIGIRGYSGAGKTTLFNCISGIDRPDSGRVVLDGQDITGQPGHISYMLQKDLLLPYKKIIDNVSLPLLLSGKSKKEARTEAGSHFAQFGLEGTQQQYPAELSGGMRQRAALLRTYLAGDRVALLDEPFSALDTITKSAMHRWYLSVMEEIKLSTIFITHDIDEAVLLSDRILILSGRPGKITHQITIAEPKPRRRDFNLTPEFLNYKKQVIDALGVVL